MVVRQVLEAQGLQVEQVDLGEVTVRGGGLTKAQLTRLDAALHEVGFERIDDRKARLIEQIKKKVLSVIHQERKVRLKFNWSTVLSDELHYDYNYLSSFFSSVEGITLEQYIIRQKIERVKELLFYDEQSLSEIADRLGYSSVAHLSSQFKKITGLTPSEMKKSRNRGRSRKSIDSIR